MTRFFASLILAAVLSHLGWLGPPAVGPTPAFQKLQALAGDWEGKDDQGNAAKTNFRVVAGGTAVLETLTASGMEEMLTLYNIDGDGLALVHYCPTSNQPRMRAMPGEGEPAELVFLFQGATNLSSLSVGHEHKLVMQFLDKDHITERWTWRKNGKDSEMVYTFARQGNRESDQRNCRMSQPRQS
jgi:hypothetical protein